jgi:deazaflavin-dependent oxidoreductase (nitroreductase family)
MATPATPADAHHVVTPGFITRRVMNPSIAGLARLGISLYGSRILSVRGRKTGEWRRTPVNPLTLGGERFLVAARGHVQWTKNLRATGEGELRLGRQTEHFTATEVPDADKPTILRAYLRKWAFEVGAFFDGVSADSPDEDLLRISGRHPIFRISAGR